MLATLNMRSAQAKARWAEVRRRGLRASLTSTEGVIDLASIMVGVIVLGIIAGGVIATVFAIIPWAQDNGAKQDLDTIRSAEATVFAVTSTDGSGHFADSQDLKDGEITIGDEAIGLTAADNIAIATTENDSAYVAVAHSGSGTTYYITSEEQTEKQEVENDEVTVDGTTFDVTVDGSEVTLEEQS